jgi:hypothetical protein
MSWFHNWRFLRRHMAACRKLRAAALKGRAMPSAPALVLRTAPFGCRRSGFDPYRKERPMKNKLTDSE